MLEGTVAYDPYVGRHMALYVEDPDLFEQQLSEWNQLDYAEPWDLEEGIPEVQDFEYEHFMETVQARFHVRRSQFVETSIRMPDPHTRQMVPFSFKERPYLRRVYDTPHRRVLLMCGRQVEKSTTLGMRILAMTCLVPHFRVLYVSPSAAQTKEFSKTRIKEMMETSPDLRVWYPPSMTDNVFEKRGINRSVLTLRYAFLNADRTRGLASDLVAIDELQDQIMDNIPVIEETASHSPYRYFLYSGTPKSLDNPIEHFWSTFSTQNEWAVPCERHGTPKIPSSWHWNILGEQSIGRKGLICDKCGGRIFPNHPMCQWVRTGTPDPELGLYEGFRIPQLMVPWIGWRDLLTKYNDYPRAKFFNECLGLSFDNGQRPLTRQDILDNCDPDQRLSPEGVTEWRSKMQGSRLYAGIDWGQDSSSSYTVIFVGGYFLGRFRVIFAHRFQGAESEPRAQFEKICRIIDTFGIHKIGVDHGGGFWPNDELLRKYGSGRVVRFQYSTPNVFMRWDARLGRFLIHRSEVMSAIFNAIKRRNVIQFPCWKDWATPYAADMLSIFSEYNERMHMTQYKKSPNNTDDSFHSLLFMFLASMLDQPRPDVFVPNARVDALLDAA